MQRAKISLEAAELAHLTGMRPLGPIFQRLMDAEAQIRELSARVAALEEAVRNTAPPHLRKVEKRS